jgi:hypothetical protein
MLRAADLLPDDLLRRRLGDWPSGDGAASRGASEALVRLAERDALSSRAVDVRRLLPSGLQRYWRGDFVRDLPDAAIEAHLAAIAEAPVVSLDVV